MSKINNEISKKENDSAKNNNKKKRKIEQESIKAFAEKIHNKHLKLNENE